MGMSIRSTRVSPSTSPRREEGERSGDEEGDVHTPASRRSSILVRRYERSREGDQTNQRTRNISPSLRVILFE